MVEPCLVKTMMMICMVKHTLWTKFDHAKLYDFHFLDCYFFPPSVHSKKCVQLVMSGSGASNEPILDVGCEVNC